MAYSSGMHRPGETIIERENNGALSVRLVAGADTERTREAIASIPGIVEDARDAGLRRIELDVTHVDKSSGCELLPTVVLACREAVRSGIALKVIAGEHLRASASVAGLSKALSIDG